jgi:hypothetical protein
MPPRLKRRRDVEGTALVGISPRGRRKLSARLWRAAEQQARKIELRLSLGHQRLDQRTEDLAALRELTRILRDLAAVEESAARTDRRPAAPIAHEQALAVEGRAVVVTRTKTG